MPVFLTDQPKSKNNTSINGVRGNQTFPQETDPFASTFPSLLQMISSQQDTTPKILPLPVNPVNTHSTTHGTPPSNGAQAHTLSRKCHLSPPLARAWQPASACLEVLLFQDIGAQGASSGTQDLWHHGPYLLVAVLHASSTQNR